MVNRQRLVVLIAVSALIVPAYADRGNDAFKRGDRAERQTNYDAAYGYYKQAYTLEPNNAKYLAAYSRMRFNAAAQHVRAGELLRNTGALMEALAEFQHAVEIDSSSFVAQQDLRRTAEMIRKRELPQSAPKVESSLAKLTDEVEKSVELQPISNAPITLHLTAVNSDVVYKTICKLAGINVLIDPDYRPQKITVDLTDVTLRDALDMVHLQSKTFWRPVLQNTIFVAGDTPAKRKELETNVMRTFYLQNVTTPNELTEAANTVRQILDISRVQLLPGQDAMVLRGTMDQMALAEKLLADIDKPRSEVVIDVTVMQVTRDRLRTLGTTLPTSASFGIVPGASGGTSGTGTGTGTAASGNSITLNTGGVSGIGSFAVAIPSGGSFTFLATDSNAKILQNPQIRALNNEKATLRIGDRVPIATGSFQPGIIGGGGVSPLVNTQFQFLDVGVNIDITPHIHADHSVTLKMALEISSVTGSESIGGITQPIIGQRRIDHETRVADGDVNLLGGILEDSETQSLSGYPWVSKLPILKYLFAQDNKEHRENEIVFAITPHIVRAQDITEENLRVVEVGTGNLTELHRKSAVSVVPTAERPPDPAVPQQRAQAPIPNAPLTGSSRPPTAPQANPAHP